MDGARRKTIGRDGWCLITLVCFFPPVRNPPSSFSSTRSLDSQHKSYANKGALCKSSYLLSFLCISRSSTRYRVLIVPMHVFVRKPFLMNRIRFIHRYTWSEENLFELYVKMYARDLSKLRYHCCPRLPNFISIRKEKNFQFCSICICGLRLAECYPNIWDENRASSSREISSMHRDESTKRACFFEISREIVVNRIVSGFVKGLSYDRESERECGKRVGKKFIRCD